MTDARSVPHLCEHTPAGTRGCLLQWLMGLSTRALLHTTPNFNQSLLELVDIVDLCLVHTLLYHRAVAGTRLRTREVQLPQRDRATRCVA